MVFLPVLLRFFLFLGCARSRQVLPAAAYFFVPYLHLLPSSSSILRSWLYFAVLSALAGAPVFICPHPSATERSAMNVSSVSPLLWLTMVFQLFFVASFAAAIASVSVPIWFGLSRRQLHALISVA